MKKTVFMIINYLFVIFKTLIFCCQDLQFAAWLLAGQAAVVLRLHSGSCKLIFWHYSSRFVIFKDFVHHKFGAWWDAELLGVSPGSKLCAAFLNIAKYFKTLCCVAVAVSCVYFFNSLKTSTVLHISDHGFIFNIWIKIKKTQL